MPKTTKPRDKAKHTARTKYFEPRNAERIIPEPEYSALHAERTTREQKTETAKPHAHAGTNATPNEQRNENRIKYA